MTPVGDPDEAGVSGAHPGACSATATNFSPTPRARASWPLSLNSYAPYKGEIQRRNTGSLVAFETGESVTYGLYNAQERGALFIGAGVPVYAGMVVGVTPQAGGHHGQRLQEEAADQYAGLRLGRCPAPDSAPSR